MKEKGIDYSHFFDPLHTLKNLRNLLLNKELRHLNGIPFNMHTLNDLRNSSNDQTRRTFRKLLPESPFPVDTMNLASVEVVLQSDVIKALQQETSPSCQELAKFLGHLKVLPLPYTLTNSFFLFLHPLKMFITKKKKT